MEWDGMVIICHGMGQKKVPHVDKPGKDNKTYTLHAFYSFPNQRYSIRSILLAGSDEFVMQQM